MFPTDSYQFARPAPKSPRIASRRGGKTSSNMFSDQSAGKGSRMGLFLLVLMSLIALLAVFTMIDSNYVRVEQVQVVIPGMDSAFEGFSILHISDLHGKRFGAKQQQLKRALDNVHFDAVCITGDITGQGTGPYDAFYELLEILEPSAKRPVFFVAGDDDPPALIGEPGATADVLAEFIIGAQRRGAIYVDAPQRFNGTDRLRAVGKSVWIMPGSLLGLDLKNAQDQYENQLRKDQESENANSPGIKARERLIKHQLEVLERAQAAYDPESPDYMQPGDLRVALVHTPLRPDFIRTLQNAGGANTAGSAYARVLDLVLAGHYNGGQVRLPFIGPVYVPGDDLPRSGWFPGNRRVQGLSQVSGIAQHISPGLGTSSAYSVPIRLFNSPRVTVLRLTSSLPIGD